MKPLSAVDPALHVVRSWVQSLDGRARQQAESARFQLFAAFEAQDSERAEQWLRALRAAFAAYAPDAPAELELQGYVRDAIADIERAIREEGS